MLKRLFDISVASIGLVVVLPLLAIVAIAIRLSSPGPIFFRQIRVGKNGKDFVLKKFRTMTQRLGSEQGTFDAGDVSRVTKVGRFLRSSKLDELPQLWNVIQGDMSLVGPRPEIRKWVQAIPERWSVALEVRPGITDPASIVYRNEEQILANDPDPESRYRNEILPHKLELYENYVRTRTFSGDLKILVQTVLILVGRQRRSPSHLS